MCCWVCLYYVISYAMPCRVVPCRAMPCRAASALYCVITPGTKNIFRNCGPMIVITRWNRPGHPLAPSNCLPEPLLFGALMDETRDGGVFSFLLFRRPGSINDERYFYFVLAALISYLLCIFIHKGNF